MREKLAKALDSADVHSIGWKDRAIDAVMDLEVMDPPTKRKPPRMALPEDDPTVHERADPRDRNRMKIVWDGPLIHINATVDRDGLEKLRQKLDAMETLLEG